MKHMKNAAITAVAALSLCCAPGEMSAQITAASNPDNNLISPSFSDIETLNCDMVTVGTGDKMTAVAFEGVTSSISYYGIHIECAGYQHDLYIQEAFHPDIVIADNTDPNAMLGEDYLVAIVYEQHTGASISDIWMNVYEFTGMGTGSEMCVDSNTYYLFTSHDEMGTNPHIDMWGDRSNTSVNNMQQLHDYIVTWDYADNITYNTEIQYVYGTLLPSGSSTVSSIYTGVTDAHLSDVGAQTALTAPGMGGVERTAWISYIEQSSNSLKLLQQDFDATLAPSSSSVTTLDNTHAFAPILPRIEAQALADITSGYATWNVVAAENTGLSIGPKIYAYNDAGGFPSATFDVWSAGTGNNGVNYLLRSPCVAGVGPNMVSSASGVGTTQFSLGYFSSFTYSPSVPGSTGGDYFSNSIDISGGNWSSTYNQYYEVNMDDQFGATAGQFIPEHKVTMAVTSSSNTGDDLYTVWYTGDYSGNPGYIKYKYSGNSYSYKPADVNTIGSDKELSIFPNPADNQLTINGVNDAEYTIVDMSGKVLLTGSVEPGKNNVDIHVLAPGVYLLNVNENGKATNLKFSKE